MTCKPLKNFCLNEAPFKLRRSFRCILTDHEICENRSQTRCFGLCNGCVHPLLGQRWGTTRNVFLSVFPPPLSRLSSVLYQHTPWLRAEDSCSHQEQTPPHHQEAFSIRRPQRCRLGAGLTCGGVPVHTGAADSFSKASHYVL